MSSCNLSCQLIFLHGRSQTYGVASLHAGPVGRISYTLIVTCAVCDLINEFCYVCICSPELSRRWLSFSGRKAPGWRFRCLDVGCASWSSSDSSSVPVPSSTSACPNPLGFVTAIRHSLVTNYIFNRSIIYS